MPVRERAAARQGANVALFDATSLTAKGIKDQLVARTFPAATVRLFTSSEDPDANLTEFAGEAMLVTRPEPDTLGGLDLAFLCGTPRQTEAYRGWPERSGFLAIDLSGGAPPEVPLVNASVNPAAVPSGPGLVAVPGAAAQMLSTVLAAVASHGGLRAAHAAVLLPASDLGQQGIDELYQQSVGLLNFQDLPRELFGRQMAFNVFPGWLLDETLGDGRGGADIASQVRRITGAGYDLDVQTIQAPVFHGHAALVRLTLDGNRDRDDLLASFRGSDEVRVARRGDKVTPVERAGQPGVLVAGAVPGSAPSTFWVWILADDLAGGRARNAVRIAETFLDGRRKERTS